MADEIQEAQHELDRLQGIISRHEGFIFTLRSWLLAIVGGLLAAYYTDNIDMSKWLITAILPAIALSFLFVEWRHINLVQAVVERVSRLEKLIVESRPKIQKGVSGWYDGPKVSESCERGADRWRLKGMTFWLNLPFYAIVIIVIVLVTISLPAKLKREPPKGSVPPQSTPAGGNGK